MWWLAGVIEMVPEDMGRRPSRSGEPSADARARTREFPGGVERRRDRALGQIVDGVKPWQPFSPFHQAAAAGPVGGGVPGSFVWLMLVALMVVAWVIPVFGRRDIRAV